MQTLEQLRRRVDSAEDLQSVVKTMKALAAVGIRQYEQAAAALAEYDRTVRLGLRAALRDVAASEQEEPIVGDGARRRVLVVAFGSDQGMCGQLNDGVAERTEAVVGPSPEEPRVFASGARLASVLERTGSVLRERFETPRSIDMVSDGAGRILAAIERARAEAGDVDVQLVFPRRTSSAGYEIHTRRILPLDHRWLAELRQGPWPTRSIPGWPGTRTEVVRALVREYLFVASYRALVDTLASEHASRLSSMQSAERNIEERLDELQGRYRRQRQTSITSELMDVVSGFEALGSEEE